MDKEKVRAMGMIGQVMAGVAEFTNHPALRPVRPDALRALRMISHGTPALCVNPSDITRIVLSGREPEGHGMLLKQVNGDRRLQGQFDRIVLNPGIGSSTFKLIAANEIVNGGDKLVVFDDDWRVGEKLSCLNMSEEEPRVLVYIRENMGTLLVPGERRKMLARRNIHFVPSLEMAALDMVAKLGDDSSAREKLFYLMSPAIYDQYEHFLNRQGCQDFGLTSSI